MTNAALETLKLFNIGNSVAEFDDQLDDYFVETETFRRVVEDRGDIIAGDKGTGKTAIYRVLKRSYRSHESLDSVEMVDAFNLQGNPIFQRLLTGPQFSEGQYRTFWKGYIFALVGNYLVDIYGEHFSSEMTELKNTLDYLGVAAKDVTPANIFQKLHNLLKSFSNPSAAEAGLTFSEIGLPVVTGKIEFGPEKSVGTEIFADDFLATLDRAAATTDLKFWVLFDLWLKVKPLAHRSRNIAHGFLSGTDLVQITHASPWEFGEGQFNITLATAFFAPKKLFQII